MTNSGGWAGSRSEVSYFSAKAQQSRCKVHDSFPLPGALRPHIEMAMSQDGGTSHTAWTPEPWQSCQAQHPSPLTPIHIHQPRPASDIDQSENQSLLDQALRSGVNLSRKHHPTNLTKQPRVDQALWASSHAGQTSSQNQLQTPATSTTPLCPRTQTLTSSLPPARQSVVSASLCH